MEIGIQQLMLGSRLTKESSAETLLLRLSEEGYSCIELNGFMIHKTPWLARALTSLSGMPIKNAQKLNWKRLLKRNHFQAISLHEDLAFLEEHLDSVIIEAETFNVHFVVLTGLYKFNYTDEEELGNMIVKLNRIGKLLQEHGLEFLYHNHNAEFQRVDEDRLVFDYLLEGLNHNWVNFEFDSYWCAASGADSLFWMERIGNRMKLYHICDRGFLKEGPSLTPILSHLGEKEVGNGLMNLTALVKQASALDVAAIILEQHTNLCGKDPALSASISLKGLKKLLPSC